MKLRFWLARFLIPAATLSILACWPASAKADASKELGQFNFTSGGPNALSGASLELFRNARAGIVIDSAGHLYVADTDNNRILGWSSASSFKTAQSADLVIGQPDFFTVTLSNASPTG